MSNKEDKLQLIGEAFNLAKCLHLRGRFYSGCVASALLTEQKRY